LRSKDICTSTVKGSRLTPLIEKPDIPDARIAACLRDAYGLAISEIAFLPLGVDVHAAVYRAVAHDGTPYFVKLRGGFWDEIVVALPRFLHDQGIAQIIAPLPTQTGQLWADLHPFKLILYPFVAGRDGYEVKLSDHHWVEFGAALQRIHTVALPPALRSCIPRESYAPAGREMVRTFVKRLETDTFDDPVAAETAAFLRTKREEVRQLVVRAERLAQALQVQAPTFTLCHADLHAGNLLIADNGAMYIVDWDNPILAPKEHDLMAVGGGLMGGWRTPQEEEHLFYQGYGPTSVDPVALAYYRHERIVQDIAAFCEQIFLTRGDGPDREQALEYLQSNFRPGGVLEISSNAEALPPQRPIVECGGMADGAQGQQRA
jgi:spectinomycin phosphotransferase